MSDKSDIKSLLRTLESSPDQFLPSIKPTRELFIPGLQIVTDIYIETTKTRGTGLAQYAQFLLLARCINDLMVGFHLACQGYVPQSYAVLRPILESLDLITLFRSHPEYADTWSDGGKRAWSDLKPSQVRKKLGRNSFDVLYGHFCDASHPTFVSGRGMSAMSITGRKRTVHIQIGGMHNEYSEPHLMILFGFCFFLQMSIYNSQLDMARTVVEDKKIVSGLKEMIRNFETFTQVFRNRGFDIGPIEGLFENVNQIIADLESSLSLD